MKCGCWRWMVVVFFVSVVAFWGVSDAGAAGKKRLKVQAPPAKIVKAFALDPFYQKCFLYKGFPIVGSEKVSDYALREAAYLIDKMLGERPDIVKALIANKVRFSVMSYAERTTDIPEHSDLTPPEYWDRRARGLGSTRSRPSVSCGEENLLCFPGDPYSTENILIHEFSHAIHQMGLNSIDATFDERLAAQFKDATAKGLWKDKYAGKNKEEYFAEAAQSWFNTNRKPDHDHNYVDTRAELREYDPGLAKLVESVFGDSDWVYKRPEKRSGKEAAHLKGYDFASAPRFVWGEKKPVK